jgi:hypothetical protein
MRITEAAWGNEYLRGAFSKGDPMKLFAVVAVCGLMVLPAASIAGERFDGTWQTTLTCPAKGDTEGYTWKFASVIQSGSLRGERGTAGEPGYLLIEGKVAEDGNFKVTANGIVYSRQYARGVLAAKGESYSYTVKGHFADSEGSGVRDQGLGIVGRPCTFDFKKQVAAPAAAQ